MERISHNKFYSEVLSAIEPAGSRQVAGTPRLGVRSTQHKALPRISRIPVRDLTAVRRQRHKHGVVSHLLCPGLWPGPQLRIRLYRIGAPIQKETHQLLA